MKKGFKLLLLVWLNILSLTFISCCFFDFNPKVVFVEIQEEQNEDGSQEDDVEFMTSEKMLDTFSGIQVSIFENNVATIIHLISNTSKGYTPDLIKPPLA